MHEATPQTSDLRLPDLKPEVQSYIAQLKKSLFVIYAKYEVKNRNELAVKVREGKVDTKDSDKVIELLKVINECGKQDKIVGNELAERILAVEKRTLSEFFKRPIDVPPLPDEITRERIKQWEKQKLELHYLPEVDMSNERHLKNWKKQPKLGLLRSTDLPNDVMWLTGCWVLVDARPKPNYKGGSEYEDDQDFLGPVLEESRKMDLIANFENPQSRYAISSEELEKPEVVAAFASACGLEPEQISLPRMIEFNVIGNIHHPEWGETDCGEWFADGYETGQWQWRLNGGCVDQGGLSYVYTSDYQDRSGKYGFRILGRFK